jgi:adenine deaminase
MVFKAGRLVAERGTFLGATLPSPPLRPTMNAAPITREALRIPAGGALARAIELLPGQIETRETLVSPRICAGEIVADPDRDLAKLVVIERHHRTGHVGRGLVRGFGLRRGALAASVAHDAHHLIAVGVDDRDLLAAVSAVVAHEGGLAVADGDARTVLPLPVAGLITDAPLEETARGLASVEAAARALGVSIDHPFGALSFLALPVVPALRLTDLGLVDATRGQLVPLSAEASVT